MLRCTFKKGKLFAAAVILFLLLPVSLPAVSGLTVEDELLMAEMVKNSHSTSELILYLRLFPYSPYQSTFRRRVFRLDPDADYELVNDSSDVVLTADDELTMNRMVRNSTNPKEIKLFLKLFPDSRLAPLYAERLENLQKKDKPPETIEDQAAQSQIEKEILAAAKEKKARAVPETEEETGAAETEETQETTETDEKAEETPKEDGESEEPEPEEEEEDWGKFELGLLTELSLADSDGDSVSTKESPSGIFLGWSHEVMFDIGGGTGLVYIAQSLGDSVGELQHLYLEAQVRGMLFDIVNWGIGYGSGVTTYQPSTAISGTEIVPGSGIIFEFSVGAVYKSFGINYMTGNISGSYQTVVTAGTSSSTTTVNWTGTFSIITLEYHY